LRMCGASLGISRSGWSSAPHVPPTQWTGQTPPSFAKWGVDSGCQSWVATTSAPADVAFEISVLIRGISAAPASDREAAVRIGEVVLHVDDEERGLVVVALHGRSLAGAPGD